MTTTGSDRAMIPAGPAVAAWGGGLLLIALGAGSLTAVSTTPIERALGAALVGAGLLAFVWGAACLARGRLVVRRAVTPVAFAAGAALVAAFLADPVGNSVLTVAATVLLVALVAGWTTVDARREAPARSRAGIVGIVVAGFIVAGLVTPALAASESARAGAERGTVVIDDGHGH